MSIAMSLLELAEAEAAKNSCKRITRVKVEYGALAGIMPEALKFCFECLIENSPHKGAVLELLEIPVKLRCPACDTVFECAGQAHLMQPCPECGALSGHNIEQGRELLLLQLEALPE